MDDTQALKKVRKLLAQAEGEAALGHEEAAEAFQSKANELLTRYQLDAAMLEATAERPEEVVTRILVCEGDTKERAWTLLHQLAKELGCRTVGSRQERWLKGRRTPVKTVQVTVAGFESDVAAAELLWTSLLVQAAAEYRRLQPPSGVNRRTFNNAFLEGFTSTVVGRVRRDRRAVVAETERAAAAASAGGPSLLPVLRDRKARVDEFCDERWGTLRKGRPTGPLSSYAGHRAGVEAGHRADLGGRRVSGGSRGALGGGR